MNKIIFWSLRSFFILLLLTTAIGKLLDNRGFAEVISTYQFGIPETLLLPLGLSVSLFELALAGGVIANIRMKFCAQLVILMHVGYTVLAVITNLRGLDLPNCGCFGIFLARPMTWATVLEDSILTLLSVIFYFSVVYKERITVSNRQRHR